MNYRLKIFLTGSWLLLLGVGLAPLHVWANPFEQLGPDQPLYQRVKHLGDMGLLDPKDREVLEEGKYVSRLELAFYTEKAKARLTAPLIPTPMVPTATPVPLSLPVAPPPTSPEAPPAAPPPSFPEAPPAAAPPTPLPTAVPVATPVPDAVKKEVDDLLKELHADATYLRSRLALVDRRIQEQEDEWDKLQKAQDAVDNVWKKANKSVGMPHFYANTSMRFENINVTGPLSNGVAESNNAMRIAQQIDLGVYTDLGGKGSLSTGFGAIIPYTNASAVYATGVGTAPVSLYIANPSATFFLYGDLGKWDTTFAVEAYQPNTTLGNFSRGFATYAIKRFEDPFDIKNFNDDKNGKNWDDYMTSVSYVPAYSASAGNVQSATDRVFDGVYAVGQQVPWLGPDGRMTVLVGRMGTSPTQTQRWEEGLKIDQPWAKNTVRTAFSTEWVNDNFGVNQPIQLDMKDFSGNVKVNLDPFFLELDGGFSEFKTGGAYSGPGHTSSSDPNDPTTSYAFVPSSDSLVDAAGQASLIYYPFTLYYSGIGPNYANFQSRVMMSGLNFFHYGLSWNPSDFNDAYGAVAEADTLQSDRYGWRFNFGWSGRKQPWMKEWPSFLDALVVNLDLAQKKEYTVELSPMGYNVIEPFTMLRFYYPDDEGLWGLNLWGNYAPNVNPLRQDTINNIQALRNDGDISNDDVRYQFRLSSERLPLIVPEMAGGVPVTYTVGTAPNPSMVGKNVYVKLDHLKTFNYLSLTTKAQVNKWIGLKSPVDLTFFMTNNVVSGESSSGPVTVSGNNVIPASIPNLFEQTVMDAALMVNVLNDIDLMGDWGRETWHSDYTYPQVDYLTNAFGIGLAYDIPWCGGKLECRFKHIDFQDHSLPANSYQGDQFFSKLKFLF